MNHTQRMFSIIGMFSLLAGLAMGVPPIPNTSAVQTVYTVTSLSDPGDGACDGAECTLREAIDAANANSGADTIVFSVDGVITLSSTLPNIADEVTINGADHRITVSDNNSVRIIDVNSGTTLNLNALTIANGLASGGDGGGIYNSGTLNVTNSTFSGNTAGNAGGAIANVGTLNVTNSTFFGNAAGSFGGGSDCGVDGGGTITANSNNIDSDGTCGNATQKTIAEIDLGPLADNGGSTQTMALLAGSAAHNAGENAICPATDQRGVPRDAQCDVGAFEFTFNLFLPLARR